VDISVIIVLDINLWYIPPLDISVIIVLDINLCDSVVAYFVVGICFFLCTTGVLSSTIALIVKILWKCSYKWH
jgi:hypothetical protein